MNTTQRTIRWTAALAVGLVITSGAAALVLAQGDEAQAPPRRPGFGRGGDGFGPAGGRGGPGGGGLVGIRLPGLTEDQRKQARAIAERYQPQTEPFRQRLQAAQRELDNAVMTSPVDEGLVRQKATEVGAAQAELAVIRAHVTSEVLGLLTPEQAQQLRERRDRAEERRQSGPRARRR